MRLSSTLTIVAALLACALLVVPATAVRVRQSMPTRTTSAEVVTAPGGDSDLYLVVAYCPTDFTGEGAIVKVDVNTGDYTVASKFKWPQEIFGCPIMSDPTIYYDPKTTNVYLDFTSTMGYVVTLNMKAGGVVSNVQTKDEFFTGFVNMAYYPKLLDEKLIGLTPTVTQKGYCNDGCYEFGSVTTGKNGGKYTNYTNVAFKAILDDSHFFDESKSKFWAQGSYNLLGSASCPKGPTECLLQINADTGVMESEVATNWTVYKYASQMNSDGKTILGWVQGFQGQCQHPYNDFLFATVDLESATATPIKCISRNITVDEDEWIAGFSADNTLMATASGDADSGEAQLLVFHTQTAQVLLETKLGKLAKELGAAEGLFDVWTVGFVPKASEE